MLLRSLFHNVSVRQLEGVLDTRARCRRSLHHWHEYTVSHDHLCFACVAAEGCVASYAVHVVHIQCMLCTPCILSSRQCKCPAFTPCAVYIRNQMHTLSCSLCTLFTPCLYTMCCVITGQTQPLLDSTPHKAEDGKRGPVKSGVNKSKAFQTECQVLKHV